LVVANDGGLSGTPSNSDVGANAFVVSVKDATNVTASATLNISVTNTNDAPVALDQSISTNEDGTANITLTGTDVDGDLLTFSIASQPAHGTVTLLAGTATYTPEPNYSGSDSFTFTAYDGIAVSSPAAVSITITPGTGNDFTEWLASYGLIASPNKDSDRDSISNAVEYIIGGNPAGGNDVALLPFVIPVTADPDQDMVSSKYLLFTYRRTDRAKNDPSTAVKVEWNTNLSGPWTNATGTMGVVTIQENDGFSLGVDRVKVYLPLSLAQNGMLFARLNVSVNAPIVNDPPVASGQAVVVNEDGSTPVTLSGTDADGDPLSYRVITGPSHGTLTGTAAHWTYTPFANYFGFDSFTFKANDGIADSVLATVAITVNPQEEFTQWMATFSLNAGPMADTDKDSITNIVEYVIGGNPANPTDSNLLPTTSLVSANLDTNPGTEDYLLFTYRRTDLANTDPSTTIRAQWATSLSGSWTDASGTPGVFIQVNDGPAVDIVSVYIPRTLAVNGKLFARLSVSSVIP
ncbi:MAG: Ig-like domain-containing protein, partial [Luteolibacter sp.]